MKRIKKINGKAMVLIGLILITSPIVANSDMMMSVSSIDDKPTGSQQNYFRIQSIDAGEGFSEESFSQSQSITTPDQSASTTTQPLLLRQALPYPSPMSWSQGNGVIGYRLSRDAELNLRIYDMQGNQIYNKTFEPGAIGGRNGYNRVEFNKSVVGYDLSTGVYPYLLLFEGSVISQGMAAVVR